MLCDLTESFQSPSRKLIASPFFQMKKFQFRKVTGTRWVTEMSDPHSHALLPLFPWAALTFLEVKTGGKLFLQDSENRQIATNLWFL